MNYYALLVALVLVTALLLRGNQQGNKKFVIVGCFLLFVIYGFRDTYVIGDDSTNTYVGGFLATGKMSWSELMNLDIQNKGYFVFNKIIYGVTGGDYQAYITILSGLVTFCFGFLVYRYSPDPLQSILYHLGILLFTFHFSALKQSAAMAILMLAFDQIFRKRPVLFYLLVVLAGTFHFPALVFLPAYLISKIHLGKYYILFVFALLAIVYLFRSQILSFMIGLYRDDEAEVSLANVQFLRTKALIMIIIVVSGFFFRFPQKDDSCYETLLIFMGIAIVFQTYCGYNNIYERLADYYFQFSVIYIPMVFDRNAKREALFQWRTMEVVESIAPYLFCGLGIYRFLTYVVTDSTLYPYRFFFQ